jgi:hypothetical protein
MATTAQTRAVPMLQSDAAMLKPSITVKMAEDVAAIVTTTRNDQNIRRSSESCFLRNFLTRCTIFS